VLPARNEAGNVGRAVQGASAAAEAVVAPGAPVEVVVVDDGSVDATASEAAGAGARVVWHPTNRGYGAAVRSGLAAVTTPWTWLLDADNQFDPGQLVLLAAHAEVADIVAGYRVRRAEGRRRELATLAWRLTAELAVGRRLVRDVDCAFKLMRTGPVQAMDLRCDGAAVSVELVWRARQMGLRVVEVPVVHLPRTVGEASGLRPAVIGRAGAELWQLWRTRRAARGSSR